MSKTEQNPLTSVIIPTYNSPSETAEAVSSVLSQTNTDFQILVIDDGSTIPNQNQLMQLLSDFQDGRIETISLKENKGVANARNIGIEKSKGHFIAFLDCDDLWHPTKLERQLKFHQSKGATISFTSYANFDTMGKAKSVRRALNTTTYKKLLSWNCIGNSTVILDSQKIGRCRIPNLRRRQDFAFWLLLLRTGHTACGLQEPLTARRLMPNSLSQNKISSGAQTWKVFREVEKLSTLRSSYYSAAYLANTLWFDLANLLWGESDCINADMYFANMTIGYLNDDI